MKLTSLFVPAIITLSSFWSCKTRVSATSIKNTDAAAVGIAAVDAVFSTLGATDLESFKLFLNDESKKAAYFGALSTYFGGNCFAQINFDVIMDDFSALAEAPDSPEKRLFFERIFESSPGSEFGLVSDVTSYNRDINEQKLMQYLQSEFLPKLKFETREFQLIRSEEAGNTLAAQLVQKMSSELAELEAKVDLGLNKKKQREEFGRIAGNFTKGPNREIIQDVAKWFLLSELRNNSAVFIRRNPDVVLAAFGSLPADAGRRRATIAGDLKGLQTAIDKLTPTVKELLMREDIFPKAVVVNEFGIEQTRKARASSTVNFVPVPKRIHSAFKGIPGGECVNGGGGFALSKHATPARWATAFLSGSMMHYAEDAGRFIGFAEWIPVKYTTNEKEDYTGKTFATMSLGGSFLSGQTLVTEGDQSGQVPTWKLWLENAVKQYPKDWVGVAKSNQCNADHSNICRSLQQDPIWLEGETLGSPQNFDHLDGMGQYLPKVIPWNPVRSNYTFDLISNMVTDLTINWGKANAPKEVRKLNMEKYSKNLRSTVAQQANTTLYAECKPIDWKGFTSATAEQFASIEFQKEFSKCLEIQPWFKLVKQAQKNPQGSSNTVGTAYFQVEESAMKGFYKSLLESGAELIDPTLIGQLLSLANGTLALIESTKQNQAQLVASWSHKLPLLDIIAFRIKGYEEARMTVLESYLAGMKKTAVSEDSKSKIENSVATTLAAGEANQVSSYIAGLLEVVTPISE